MAEQDQKQGDHAAGIRPPASAGSRRWRWRAATRSGAVSTPRRSSAAASLGANDRVVLASIGVRGQGNALKRGFARLQNVEIKTLCDIDANLGRRAHQRRALADVPTFKPGFVQDLRRVLDDKDIDARRHRHAEPLARARHDLGAAGRQARLRREARVAHRVGRPQDGRGGSASTTRSSRSGR